MARRRSKPTTKRSGPVIPSPGSLRTDPGDLAKEPADGAPACASAAPGPQARAPLADRMRPRTLDEIVGQDDLIGKGTLLRRAIESDSITSMILWGPPGSGKTSLARVIAGLTNARFVSFSAVVSGVAEVRAVIAEAQEALSREGRRTILFVDEIHRFNKAQQDAFLPHVESGTITLIGATTENPSFELTGPLLSRCRVFVLQPLRPEHVRALLERALADEERGLGSLRVRADREALDFIVNYSNGDARVALGALELAAACGRLDARGGRRLTLDAAKEAMQRKSVLYDKSGEEHFNLISALHKSLRGSDAQAALYWLARMLVGGEDPLYIARRLVRFATEDVGLADPQALQVAVAAKEAVDFVGMPECDLALAEAAVYLAAAPKSNSLYAAMNEAKRDISEREAPPVPLHIRNAPTDLMKRLGYGRGYRYDHDEPGHIAPQTYLPDELAGRVYYRPGEYGFEREIAKRLAYWERMRASRDRRGQSCAPAGGEGMPRADPRAGESPASGPAP